MKLRKRDKSNKEVKFMGHVYLFYLILTLVTHRSYLFYFIFVIH